MNDVPARRPLPLISRLVLRRSTAPAPECVATADPGGASIVRATVPALAAGATLVAAFALILALGDALVTPGRYGLALGRGPAGHRVARWVLPGGPAWNAGVRADQSVTLVGRGMHAVLVAWVGGRRLVLPRAALAPTGWAVLDAGLGLLLLALGLLVVRKSLDRATGLAFWRTCLCAGVTLALIPSADHGRAWALFAQALAVRLFAPSLLSLALAIPARRAAVRPRTWHAFALWLPAVALIPPYVALWVQPVGAGLATTLRLVDDVVLGGYLLAACAVLVAGLRRASTPHERAQGRWLAAGVAGGVLPFVLLSLLPLVVVGQELVPTEVSVLAMLVLPLCLACAIVRVEAFASPGWCAGARCACSPTACCWASARRRWDNSPRWGRRAGVGRGRRARRARAP